jgi:MscS family membrane protein
MSPVRALTFVALVLTMLVGTTHLARAQTVRPASPLAASTSAPERAADEEAVDSPRASMRSFLDLCDRGRYDEAARYIDVPRGAEKRAAELARKLHEVLQERLWVDPERLSPLAHGKADDALPAGTEVLGKIVDAKGHPLSIRIVRHEPRSAEDEPRWIFAQGTVVGIEAVHASLRGRWVRDHLPAPLLVQGPKALYYWQWLAIPVLALACVALGRLLTSLSDALARQLTSKWPWSARLLLRLRRPVTMAWALALFWALAPRLALALRAEDFVERVLSALGYLAFFWALVRAVAVAGDEIAEAQWAAARPNMRSITGVGVRLGKVVVLALALMVTLSELGYPVTTVVAGLGIGGVALALAAQKTVENLFGSVSILADQPFGVGDLIRVDGVEGWVETIGVRSTRLRTLERTLVILPNGKLADMRVESLGARDRIRFSTRLSLRRDTAPAQVEALVKALREDLRAHPKVRKEDVFVRMTGIGESSFDVDVAAPVETVELAEFSRVREELLLLCIRGVEGAGVSLAVPARELLGARPEDPARERGAGRA